LTAGEPAPSPTRRDVRPTPRRFFVSASFADPFDVRDKGRFRATLGVSENLKKHSKLLPESA
jgi:hypothetical protein